MALQLCSRSSFRGSLALEREGLGPLDSGSLVLCSVVVHQPEGPLWPDRGSKSPDASVILMAGNLSDAGESLVISGKSEWEF